MESVSSPAPLSLSHFPISRNGRISLVRETTTFTESEEGREIGPLPPSVNPFYQDDSLLFDTAMKPQT